MQVRLHTFFCRSEKPSLAYSREPRPYVALPPSPCYSRILTPHTRRHRAMQHTPTQGNRWLVASMGTLLQLCLGTVYAWSYFQKPIMERFGWSNSQTAWTFSIAIAALGLAAAWGGMNLAKYGPRRLTRIGSILFSAGYLLGALAFALKSLALLYLGYGIIGGIGLVARAGVCWVAAAQAAAG